MRREHLTSTGGKIKALHLQQVAESILQIGKDIIPNLNYNDPEFGSANIKSYPVVISPDEIMNVQRFNFPEASRKLFWLQSIKLDTDRENLPLKSRVSQEIFVEILNTQEGDEMTSGYRKSSMSETVYGIIPDDVWDEIMGPLEQALS